jgi:hypothetical protein
MLNIVDIENKLRTWVVAQTSRTTIFEYPNAPRPSLPYITLHILNLMQIGHDFVKRPTSTVSGSKIWGNREFTLSVKHYGTNSLQMLEQLRSSLEKPTVQAFLDELSIAFVDRLMIQSVPELIDTRFEERAVMDLLFRVPNEITDTDIGIVSTVKIEKTFKDENLQTTLIENVTIPEP